MLKVIMFTLLVSPAGDVQLGSEITNTQEREYRSMAECSAHAHQKSFFPPPVGFAGAMFICEQVLEV